MSTQNLRRITNTFDDGTLEYEGWINSDNRYQDPSHNQPALIQYFKNGKPAIKAFHNNGDIRKMQQYNISGTLKFEATYSKNPTNDKNTYHSYNGDPSLILFGNDGKIKEAEWHKDGKRHREGDLPAQVIYGKRGRILLEEWCVDGELFRENQDLPNFILYKFDKARTQSGKIIDTPLPATQAMFTKSADT